LTHPPPLSFPTRRSSDLGRLRSPWAATPKRNHPGILIFSLFLPTISGMPMSPVTGTLTSAHRILTTWQPRECVFCRLMQTLPYRSEEHTSELQSLRHLVC